MLESVRPPAVAGSFYPAEPGVLGALVDRLLAEASAAGEGRAEAAPEAVPEALSEALPEALSEALPEALSEALPEALPKALPKALIVPHAGYVYSGPIAAAAFARIAAHASRLQRVVIVGPAHRVYIRGLAWPGAARLRTPLGEVAVDLAAVDAVGALPGVVAHVAAHAREHSLEVMLPFLQRLAPQAKILPLLVGDAPAADVGRVLEALWGGPETLIVISSDLSHYHPYAEARARDERTAARIARLDGALSGDDACGAAGINGLLWVARQKGMRVELVDLRSSGDTAGSREEVVGYGAFALHEEAA